jgi:hypothetical protein
MSEFDAVARVLGDYFDGLHHGDTAVLRRVFHPQAGYYTATDGQLLHLDMATYFPIVDKRPSPASQGHARSDRILSIEFVGSVTALARVQCAIPPKAFTDLLSLVKLEGRWQIVSKVFHYELQPPLSQAPAQD